MKRLLLIMLLLAAPSLAQGPATGGQPFAGRTPTISARKINNIRYANQFPGADWCAKVANALTDLPSTGGTVDARGLEGTQSCAADPFTGVTKLARVVVGAATVSVDVSVTAPANITLDLYHGGIFSVATTKTLTINGPLVAPPTKIFTLNGTGVVSFAANGKLDQTFPQWWGATGDGTTDDSAAIQAALTEAATSGKRVRIPRGGASYNMGTTGLTQTGVVTLDCDPGTQLIWGAGFTGTALTLTGNYNRVENCGFWMPKSAAAPNSAIIAIDMAGPLNELWNVRTDQTSAGNNSPWYTGVRVGNNAGISNSIHNSNIHAYDVAIKYNIGSPRSDLTIADTEAVAQITAAIYLSDAIQSTSITGSDIECASGGLYGIFIDSSTAEIAGATISGNIITGCATSGIYINANASFPARGIHIAGNEINETAGTNAIHLVNTVGASITGNYLKGGTNWLNLATSNLDYEVRGNYTSGSLSATGTLRGTVNRDNVYAASADAHVWRNTSTGDYTDLHLRNDQNSAARELALAYTGSTYPSVYFTSGPTGEQGAIGTSGAYPLVFGTSNTARAYFNSSGHLLWAVDNTLDIGASGATRPRTGYFGTSVITPAITIGGGTSVTQHLSATASLDFTALAANTCEVLTITVTGAADGNTVVLGVPTALADVDGATERTTFFGWVSAADTVSVRRCNVTAGATAEPAAATVRADVWKH